VVVASVSAGCVAVVWATLFLSPRSSRHRRQWLDRAAGGLRLVQAFKMGFASYSRVMALPTIAAGVTSVATLFLLFRTRLPTEPIVVRTSVDPRSVLRDRSGAAFGSACLLACLVLLSVAPVWDLPLWIITLVFAVIVATRNLIVYPLTASSARALGGVSVVSGDSSSGDAAADGVRIVLADDMRRDVDTRSVVDVAVDLTPVAAADSVVAGGAIAVADTGAAAAAGPSAPSDGAGAERSPLCFMDAVWAMPWAVVPFVLGMFILVESLTHSGFIELLASASAAAVGSNRFVGVYFSGGTAAILCRTAAPSGLL
jgi:hypothetical protein